MTKAMVRLFEMKMEELCRLALKGEAVNYFKELERRSKKEVIFANLSEQEGNGFSVMDEYNMGRYCYKVLDYAIKVKII